MRIRLVQRVLAVMRVSGRQMAECDVRFDCEVRLDAPSLVGSNSSHGGVVDLRSVGATPSYRLYL